jgi:4-diphosphocytidyl-2-C-methyl-D-erythritol kinase
MGERLTAVAGLPDLPLVLAYPGVPIATAEIFAGHSGVFDPAMPALPDRFETVADVTRWLRLTRNSLEDVARLKAPVIAGVLQALAAAPGAMMSRMSGSGSTCFGIFPFPEAAEHAARMIHAAEPNWWVVATIARGSTKEKGR